MTDWSNVKAVTIPEGEVKEISIDGILKWQLKTFNPVEYIQSTGSQYIRLPVQLNPSMIIEMNLRIDRKGGEVIFGTRNNGETAVLKYNSTTTWLVQTTNGAKQFGLYKVGDWNHIIIDYPNQRVLLNDVEFKFAPYTFAQINKGLLLFAFDDNGQIKYQSNISLKDLKITNSTDTIADYRAAIDDSGRPALYDVLSEKYEYNIGLGEFGYKLLDGTLVPPTGPKTLDIDSTDGDLGYTNVIGPDNPDDPYNGLTEEEIAEIEAIRQANGI